MNQAAQTLLKLQSLLDAGLPLPVARSVMANELRRLPAVLSTRVAALFALAETYGGSTSFALEALRIEVQGVSALKRKVQVAAATPKMTAKLILALPLAVLGLAQLVGLNVVGLALRSPVVAASLAMGGLLLWLNHKFLRRMLARAVSQADALVLEHREAAELIVRLSAGAGATSSGGTSSGAAASPSGAISPSADPAVLELIHLANRYGAQLSALLKNHLQQASEQARFEIETNFAALQTKMLTPVALLALPALAFLAIIPVVMTLITN